MVTNLRDNDERCLLRFWSDVVDVLSLTFSVETLECVCVGREREKERERESEKGVRYKCTCKQRGKKEGNVPKYKYVHVHVAECVGGYPNAPLLCNSR